jgi:predicted transposase/invertase (TIGR01784 family)
VLKFSEMYESRGQALPVDLKEEEGIEMAVEAMRQASASEQVREMIEFRRKAEHDEATRLESARLEALEKGRQEGRQEGQQEAARTMARRMRDAGLSADTIREVTGLDEKDLDTP